MTDRTHPHTQSDQSSERSGASRQAGPSRRSGRPDLGALVDGLLGGKGGGSGVAKVLPAVLGMVGGSGGLGGLVAELRSGGLGRQVGSWISADAANEKVSDKQIAEALGPERIDEVARQADVSAPEAARGLAGVLPQTVDELTPGGEVPAEVPGFDAGRLRQQMSVLFAGGRSGGHAAG